VGKTVLQTLKISDKVKVFEYYMYTVHTPLHGGNIRLQSEPDLLLLRNYCCKGSWSFNTVSEVHELGSCVCVPTCDCVCLYASIVSHQLQRYLSLHWSNLSMPCFAALPCLSSAKLSICTFPKINGMDVLVSVSVSMQC